MPRKTIVRLSVKPAFTPEAPFRELLLSPGSASIEISSKKETPGLVWTTKITATLVRDDRQLHEPCIFRVRTTEAYYIIGTEDIPAQPTHKEEHLVVITIEYKSRTKPTAHKKVLSIAPACE